MNIKKSLALGALFLALALIVVACGGAAAPTSAPPTTAAVVQPTTAPVATTAPQPTSAPADKPVTITVWHQWDGKYLEPIQAAFADYTKMHPNVKIDLSKPDDVNNALKVAIPAGQGPDIIGWANDQIGQSAIAGNIVALDELGITMDFLKSNFEPAAIQGVVWQEKIWGLPESQEGIALVYNKALVTDEFLPKDAANLDDLLTKAKAFQAKNPDKTLVCNQGFGGKDAYHVAPVFFGFGVPSYVDDTGKSYLDTPDALKAGQWMADISKVSAKEQTYDICLASLKDGKVGMWWTGPWAIAAVEEAKIDYGIAPMGRPFVGIKTLLLSKNAVDRGNTDVALDIIKYFTSADVQKKLALTNKTIPAATAALKDPEVAKLQTIKDFGAALNSGVPMANTPFASAQWDPVGAAALAIWTGAQTPELALKDAQAAIEAAIAQMK